MQLLADVLAMADDCGQRDAQLVSNLLVEESACHQCQHLLFARRDLDGGPYNLLFGDMAMMEVGMRMPTMAHLVQKGRKLHVWNVEITDSTGDIISVVHVTNYIISPKKEKTE